MVTLFAKHNVSLLHVLLCVVSLSFPVYFFIQPSVLTRLAWRAHALGPLPCHFQSFLPRQDDHDTAGAFLVCRLRVTVK